VLVGCGSKLAGTGEEKVRRSLTGRMLRLRCPTGTTVKEIGEPTVAVGERRDAQAGSEVAVIVPVVA
jgi:hypothetical protein